MSDVAIQIFLPTSLRPGQKPQREERTFNPDNIRSVQPRIFDDQPDIRSIILLKNSCLAPDGSFLIDGFFSPLSAESIKQLICAASPQPLSPHLFPKPRLITVNGMTVNRA